MSDREISWERSDFNPLSVLPMPAGIVKPPKPPLNDPSKKRVYGWDDRPLHAEQKLDNLFHAVTNVLHVLKTAYGIGSPLAHAQVSSRNFGLTYAVGMSFIAHWGGRSGYWDGRSGYCFDMKEPSGNYFQVYAHRVGWAQSERDVYPAWDALQSEYDPRMPGDLHLPKMSGYRKAIDGHNAWIFNQDLATLRKLYRPPHTHEPEPGTVDWVIKQDILQKEGKGVTMPLWKANLMCAKSGY